MTIIKQKAVSSERHARNLKNYINGKDALLRDSQNIYDPADWYAEMEEVRKEYGHDIASREGARNTIIYHQILAFLPEEADINGGPMTPQKCMEYAKEYAEKRYGDYMVAFALHLEKSPTVVQRDEARESIRNGLKLDDSDMSYIDRALERVYSDYEARGRIPRRREVEKALRSLREEGADRIADRLGELDRDPCGEGTDKRYAVHMAINRTNLETKKRLAEGRGEKAKRDRAEAVRRMDEFWGLKEVEAGKRNSQVHPKQPPVGKMEKEMEANGRHSYKADLRQLSQAAGEAAVDMEEFASLMREWGAVAVVKGDKVYVGDADHPATKSGGPYMFAVGNLDPALKPEPLKRTMHNNATERLRTEIREASARKQEERERRAGYMERLDKAFEGYRRLVFASKGTPYDSFPKLKLPKVPDGLKEDGEIQQRVLELRRQADMLRSRYASGKPVPRKTKRGTATEGGTGRNRTMEQGSGTKSRKKQR